MTPHSFIQMQTLQSHKLNVGLMGLWKTTDQDFFGIFADTYKIT